MNDEAFWIVADAGEERVGGAEQRVGAAGVVRPR